MKILKHGKICWLLQEESIIAIDHWQATTYQLFGYPNRQPLQQMRETLLKSRADEYNNWVEAISLATKFGIKGYATHYRSEWKKLFD